MGILSLLSLCICLARVNCFALFPQSRGASYGAALKVATSNGMDQKRNREVVKDELLNLIQSTPSNKPTSAAFTKQILSVVRDLEDRCPTDPGDVLGTLGGNWELLWTAQDVSDNEWGLGLLRRWIK